MNTLSLLILEHLILAGSNPIPDGSLFTELKAMTHPVSTQLDWNISTQNLEKRGFIEMERDELTDEKTWFITKSGRVVFKRYQGKQEEKGE